MNKYKWGHIPTLWIYIGQQMVSSGAYALLTYLTGQLTNQGMVKNLTAMSQIALWMGVTAFVLLFVDLLGTTINFTYVQKSMVQMKRRYIDDVLSQDIINLQKDKIGRMLSNLTNDFDRYETKYVKNITLLVGMMTQFVWAVLLMGTVHPWLMIVPFVLLFFFWNFSHKSSKPIKEKEKEKSESLKAYTEYINETIQGYEVIKQHQLEVSRHQKFMEHAFQVQKDNYQVDVKSTHVEAKNSFVINLVLMSLLVIGMLTAVQINVPFGNMIVIFAAFSQIMWPISQLGTTLAEIGGIEDILKSFGETFKVNPSTRTQHVEHFERLKFESTDLGYADETILKDVNLEINHGEKVLIVGPSGAGKSTILKTIRQTTPALSNRVSLNGMDIAEIIAQDYYSLFSTVDQIGFLFNGRLIDNITLYHDIDKKVVSSVMNQVGLGGLDTNFLVQNDGGNLSGGQRARVLLARALCLGSEVIICDEIFASLDAAVARNIESDLLAINKTTINVSHIFFEENLPLYDKIYIVENGTVRMADSIVEVQERMLEYEMKGQS